MKTQKFTQIGTFSIAILAPFIILMVWLLITSHLYSRGDFLIVLILLLIFLGCLLTFYRLTIEVSEESITIRFGVGWFAKRFRLSDVASCIEVRNAPIYGIGIRLIENGWLYNVSGLKAVEITFKGRRRVVRLGTDRPEEVCDAIHLALGNGGASNSKPMKPRKDFLFWLLLGAVLGAPAFFIAWGVNEPKVIVGGEGVTIPGMYGVTIPFNAISSVDTVAVLPPLRMRTNGFALGSNRKGYFKTKDNKMVRLFTSSNSHNIIRIEVRNSCPIYIGFKDKVKALQFYHEMSGGAGFPKE